MGKMTCSWVFPGQGSQSVGMASGFRGSAAAEVFDCAKEILGWDVRFASQPSSDDFVGNTEVAQPAILTVSVAAARTLEGREISPDFVAGHSVGEFAALVAAGALGFEDALRSVVVRAAAMARAGRETPGGMAAILGLPEEDVAAVCASVDGVGVAGINTPAQIVISGERNALNEACRILMQKGARRPIPLKVNIPAHSPSMEPAVAALRTQLDRVTFRPPHFPFVSGMTGRAHSDPREFPGLLLDALTKPVRWASVVQTLTGAGVHNFVEVGPGRVLLGLLRSIDRSLELHSCSDDAGAESLAGRLACRA